MNIEEAIKYTKEIVEDSKNEIKGKVTITSTP